MPSTGGVAGAGGTPSTGGKGGTSAGGADVDAGNGGAANGGAGGSGPSHQRLYVAGQTNSGSMITVYDVDPSTWMLSAPVSVSPPGLASFLAFSKSSYRLYATDEQQGLLRAYRQDPATGALTVLNAVMTAGHPTHVAVDPAGRFVFGADYNEGKVEVYGVDQMGALAATSVDAETPGSQTHELVFSPDGKFAFVPCKGSDKVAQFKYDSTSGALDPNTPPSVASAQGAGPRHMAFTPDGRHAYVIDENGNTMETMEYDATAGTFNRNGAITTLPMGFNGSSTAAEVAVAPSGHFLYGSNRIVGMNGDIVIYSIGSDGTLTLVGHQDTHGQQPRHFSLDPTGKALFVANLDSSQVVVFRIDDTTGKLTFVAQTDVAMKPYFAGVGLTL
jgi:6-phosphogluconolactonase